MCVYNTYKTSYLLAYLAGLVDKHEVVTVHEMFHEEVEQTFTENRGYTWQFKGTVQRDGSGRN